MDYEKAYKEALNWMRSIYPTMQGTDREDAEHYFPELKESEDEKIRKDCIKYLNWEYQACSINEDKMKIEKCVSWLEKQSEQNKQHLYDIIIVLWDLLDKIDTFADLQIDDTNPDNPFRKIEDITQERRKFVKSDGYNLYIKGKKITDFQEQNTMLFNSTEESKCEEKDNPTAYLEKQGERTDYNPYKATIESIAAMVENYANNGDLKDFYNNVAVKCHDAIEYDKTWEKQGEQKADWSEEDEKFVVDTINFLYRAKNQYAQPVRLEECIDWIKSIKDRVQPQPKQEWSEEDELVLKQLIYVCHQNGWTTVEGWLKSLKPNHWKPSEEQLNALKQCIGGYYSEEADKKLESLYDDLKKL